MSKEKKSKATIGAETLDQGSANEDLIVQEPKVQETKETKRQEIKLQETKKPANLRADVTPNDGYVLSVDGKLKKRFDTSDQAMSAGLKLKQNFPVVQVAVFDAAARSYTPVALPEK